MANNAYIALMQSGFGAQRGRVVEDPGMTLRKAFVYGTIVLIYGLVIAFSAMTCLGLPIAILSLIVFLVQFYYSDRIMLKATGARLIERPQAEDLFASMDALSARVGVKAPRIAIVNSGVPNAFATGRNEGNAVIAFTTGLLEQLDSDEFEAVAAHELSHIKNKDMFVVTFASFAVTMLSWVVYLILHTIFSGDRTGIIADLAANLVSWVLSSTIGVVLVNTVSRYREYGADRGSAMATGNPDALISALLKITAPSPAAGGHAMDPVKAVLTGSSSRSVSELFSTHPPVEKRISALRRIKLDPGGPGVTPVDQLVMPSS